MTARDEDIAEAWKTAAKDLAITVVVPFTLEVDGRSHVCVAWVPDFGGSRGILVVPSRPPDFVTHRVLAADAEREGYGASFVNVEVYGRYDRDEFIDTLREWGFTGAEHRRPAWLDDVPRG